MDKVNYAKLHTPVHVQHPGGSISNLGDVLPPPNRSLKMTITTNAIGLRLDIKGVAEVIVPWANVQVASGDPINEKDNSGK